MALANVFDGLRVGGLVEVTESGPLSGKIGQITSRSGEVFNITLTDGTECSLSPSSVKIPTMKRPGMGGDDTSFDLLLTSQADEGVIAEEVTSCLFEKGFCVLRVCEKAEELEKSVEAARGLAAAGKLERLPEEVEQGYLGVSNRGKVTWLGGAEFDAPKDSLFDKYDRQISSLASTIAPYCTDLLGTQVDERTPALMSLSLTDDEEHEYQPKDADDKALGHFLQAYRRTQLKVVHFMGPAAATVTLENTGEAQANTLPCKKDSIEISAGPNTILIFRTGVFTYSCQSSEEFLSLSVSILEHMDPYTMFDCSGDSAFRGLGDGPPGPLVKEPICVVNMATRLMAHFDEAEGYRAGLHGGADCGVEIPMNRWDISAYWSPVTDDLQPWMTPTRHQSVVEGVELFDNKFFEIVANEARMMDPMQRLVLEVGAKNLFQMGITKQISNRNPHHGGCSVGLDKDDWDDVQGKPEGGQNVQAIIANRFSFIFNLRGPNYVADTACSASLCATHLAKFTLVDRTIDKIQFHIAMGLHLCLVPRYFLGGKNNTMNSAIGRCLTFNATASGYMRGDGCSSITLKCGEGLDDERDAVWRASMCGQNGRSATLTAPNGLAQGDVIDKAYKEARIAPSESLCWSCHGTGTSLGDPIEVGAVRRIQVKAERTESLILLTNKTHTGHLEGGAAMTSIIAAVLMVKQCDGVPVNHLRQLNPNLEQSAFDAFYTSEIVSQKYFQTNTHVSSFGFGGTNGHLILWGENITSMPDIKAVFMKQLKKRGAPEVRVNGSDPMQWEWDGPDKDLTPGATYRIEIKSDDPEGAPIRWEKVGEELEDADDGEDDFYCITGPFNDWDDGDRLEGGPIIGLHQITLDVPESGEIEFRFLKSGSEDEVLYPEFARCTRKAVSVLGPSSEDKGKEKNMWLAEGTPGGLLKVELFVCRGRRSVSWSPAE